MEDLAVRQQCLHFQLGVITDQWQGGLGSFYGSRVSGIHSQLGSASIVDEVVLVCLALFHEIASPANKNK